MATAPATDRRTMTALEMRAQLEWAEAIVHFSWRGHVTAEGRVRVIPDSNAHTPCSVWVGQLCLGPDAIVDVVGDKVIVHGSRQGPRS